jgi:hypothetical protein
MMRTLLKGRAIVIAACSLANAKKSWYAGVESEIHWISQTENRMLGKEQGREKMFWMYHLNFLEWPSARQKGRKTCILSLCEKNSIPTPFKTKRCTKWSLIWWTWWKTCTPKSKSKPMTCNVGATRTIASTR